MNVKCGEVKWNFNIILFDAQKCSVRSCRNVLQYDLQHEIAEKYIGQYQQGAAIVKFLKNNSHAQLK